MQLIKTVYRLKCELGACKNTATRTIKMARTGVRAAIHVCDDCLLTLYHLIGGELVPKSIETAKPEREKSRVRRKPVSDTAEDGK